MIPIRDTVPSRCVPIATIGLIAANVLVFLQQRALPPALQERFVFLFGALSGSALSGSSLDIRQLAF